MKIIMMIMVTTILAIVMVVSNSSSSHKNTYCYTRRSHDSETTSDCNNTNCNITAGRLTTKIIQKTIGVITVIVIMIIMMIILTYNDNNNATVLMARFLRPEAEGQTNLPAE